MTEFLKKLPKPNFTLLILLSLCLLETSCKPINELEKLGQHYQKNQDYQSLNKALALIPLGADTSLLREVLGEPIDMGFDFRYLIDSAGPQGCVVGAVFHIDEAGKIDQKWLDEICE